MANKKKPSKETLDKWHNDPTNWKWGIFYFNKEDKRILPPKKIPDLGWTINFANPISVMVFVVFIAVVLVITRYLMLL